MTDFFVPASQAPPWIPFTNANDTEPLPQEQWDPDTRAAFNRDRSRYLPYQPNYWDDPWKVARYYHTLNSLPPGTQPPEGIDLDKIGIAYKYLSYRNNDRPWWTWNYLDAADPGREFLRQIPTPSKDLLWPGEENQFATQLQPGEALAQPWSNEAPAAGNVMELPGGYKIDMDQLPPWQRFLLPVVFNPMFSGGVMGAGFGGVAGMVGGPVGAAAGAGVGFLVGAGLGLAAGNAPKIGEALQTNFGLKETPNIADWLMKLDIPAEAIERSAGTASQLIQSALNPDQYGTFSETLAQLPYAWQAAHLTYEAGFTQAGVTGGVQRNVQGWPVLGQGAGVWTPPAGVDPSTWTLYQMRKELASGATPDSVYNKYSVMFGMSGMLKDLGLHAILDPLNVVGRFENRVIALKAGLDGNDALRIAAISTRGPIEAFQEYGTLLRTGQAGKTIEEISQMGATTRWLAGIAKEGAPLDELHIKLMGYEPSGPITNLRLAQVTGSGKLGKIAGALTLGVPTAILGYGAFGPVGLIAGAGFGVFGYKGGLSYLMRMTPEARATEVTNDGAMNMLLVLERAGDDPATMHKYMQRIADTPEQVAKELSINSINAPDGAVLPLMARDFVEKSNTMLTSYAATQWQRAALDNIAQITGHTAEEIIEEMAHGNPEVLLKQYVEAARKSGSPAGAEIVKAFDLTKTDPANPQALNVAKFTEVVKSFTKDGLAWNDQMYRGQYYSAIIEHADAWAAKWFNVAPDPSWIRLSRTIKSAQSLVLLGLNPLYFVNNTINNIVTMAAVGVFGLRSPERIAEIWDRIGITPARLHAGLGAAAEGDITPLRAIHAAGTPEGTLTNIDRFIKGDVNKIGVFTKWSGDVEKWSSAQAYTSGFLNAWDKLWRPKVGFDPLPPALTRTLSAIDPNLPNVIHDAIASGMNQKEIESNLWTGITRRSIDSMIPDIARRNGMDEVGVKSALSQTGAYDFLKTRLQGDPTDAQVHQAFQDLNDTVQRHIDTLHRAELEAMADQAKNRVITEGAQAALDLYDDVESTRTEWHLKHFADVQRTFDETEGLEPAARNAAWRKYREDDRAGWQRVQDNTIASYTGISKALGIDNPQSRAFIEHLVQSYDNWDVHFRERDRALSEYFANIDQYQDRATRIAAWSALQDKLDALYAKHAADEGVIQAAMDEKFYQMFEQQFGAGKGAGVVEWRTTLRADREAMIQAIKEHAAKARYMKKEERDAAWTIFLNDTYRKYITDRFVKSTEGVRKIIETQTGVAPPPAQQPAIPPLEGRAAEIAVPPEQMRPMQEQPQAPPSQSEMGALLRSQGYTDDQINAFTPEQASAALRGGQAKNEIVPTPLVDKLAQVGYTPEEIASLPEKTAAQAYKEGKKIYTPEMKGREATRLAYEIAPDDLAKLDDNGAIFPIRKHLIYAVNFWAKKNYTGLEDMDPDIVSAALAKRKLAKEQVTSSGMVLVNPQAQALANMPRDQLPAGLSQAIMEEAERLRSELSSGEGPGVNQPKQTDTFGVDTPFGSTNIAWYQQLYAQEGLGRDAIDAALGRIIKDEGADRAGLKTVQRMKEMIVDRLGGHTDAITGVEIPSQPNVDLWMGNYDEAARSFGRWFTEFPEATDADWVKLLGTNDVDTAHQLYDWLLDRYYQLIAEDAYTGPERRELTALRAEVDRLKKENAGLKVDVATQLPLYVHFREQVDPAPAKVMVDIMGLKYLNDNFGHDAGNVLLAAFGKVAQEYGFNAYRMGDAADEFIIPYASIEEANAAKEALRAAFQEATITVDDHGTIREYKGADFHAGTGATIEEADAGIIASKAGNPTRGRLPPSMVEIAPAREQVVSGNVPVGAELPPTQRPISEAAAGPAPAPTGRTLQDLTEQEQTFASDLAHREYLRKRTDEWYARMQTAKREEPGTLLLSAGDYRQAFEQSARDIYNLPADRVSTVMDLQDARARVWAKTYGKTVDDYYRRFVGYASGEPPEGALEQVQRGAMYFTQDGQVILHAMTQPNVSTVVHELAHVWRRDLMGEDLAVVEGWAGVQNSRWEVEHEELFARGFERYLAEGIAPTVGLRRVFENFKRWLLEIYTSIKGSQIAVPLTDDVRGVFDRLLDDSAKMTPEEVKGQIDMFNTQPVLPMKGQTAAESVFTPQEAARQGSMFPELTQPQMKGAKVVETPKEEGPLFNLPHAVEPASPAKPAPERINPLVFTPGERIPTGTRIVMADGTHGEIIEVHGFTMQSIFGGQKSETDYYYQVRTDAGHTELVGKADNFTPEVGPAPQVVKDVLYNGEYRGPTDHLRDIENSKVSEQRATGMKARAKKPDMKRRHQMDIDAAKVKTKELQDTWDSWATKNPDAAAKAKQEYKQRFVVKDAAGLTQDRNAILPEAPGAALAATPDIANAGVALNDQFKGIDLRFQGRPSDDVLAWLHRNGFKWSRRQSKWYASDIPEVRTQLEKAGYTVPWAEEAAAAPTNLPPSAFAPLPERVPSQFTEGEQVTYQGKMYEVAYINPDGETVELSRPGTSLRMTRAVNTSELTKFAAEVSPEMAPTRVNWEAVKDTFHLGDVVEYNGKQYQVGYITPGGWIDLNDPVTHERVGRQIYSALKQLPATEAEPFPASALETAPPAPTAPIQPREQTLLNHLIGYFRPLLFTDTTGRALSQQEFESTIARMGFDLGNELDLNLAYDLMEGAFNHLAREMRADMTAKGFTLAERLTALDGLEQRLTPARRTLRKMELQEFSTPLTLSEAADYAADVRPGDVVGETTAGNANLVDGLSQRKDITLKVNEIDPGRRKVLTALGYEPTGLDLMKAEWLLSQDPNGMNRLNGPYSNVMVVNPPWGSYSTGKYGAPLETIKGVHFNDWSQRFTSIMMDRMPDGGRLVEIAPINWVETLDRTTRVTNVKISEYVRYLMREYNVRAIIESPPGAYDARGTKIQSLMVVIDKISGHVDGEAIVAFGTDAPKNWDEYAALVERIPKRDEGSIYRGQQAIKGTLQPQPTGPAATGLTDPAALRGEPRGDPAQIGRPTQADVERTAGRGGTNEPTTELPPAQPGGVGPREGANVEQPPREARVPGPGLVEGEPPAVRGRADITGYSPEFQRKVNDGRAAIASTGSFAEYVGRSPLRSTDTFHTHPNVVVETKSLAGVPYPDLEVEFRPSDGVMRALKSRAISVEGNLDPVWAAIQQNDKYHMAAVIADDVGMGKARTGAAYVIDRIEKGKKRILVVTKGQQNVENLMNVEFPGVWAGKFDENGAMLDAPTDFPGRRVFVNGVNFPKIKKGLEEIPTFDEPTVYFMTHTEFQNFRERIKALEPDVVLIDEAHEFKNTDTKRGSAWYDLHKDWVRRDVDMLYMTATPGTDLADLQYLYGLKVWGMDGFEDWIKVITGQESPEKVKERIAATDRINTWVEDIKAIRDAVQTKDVTHNVPYEGEVTGLEVTPRIFIYKANDYYHRNEFAISIPDTSGNWHPLHYVDSETQAVIFSGELAKIPDYLRSTDKDAFSALLDIQRKFKAEHPEPTRNDLRTVEMRDASDILVKSDKKQWGNKGKTAFEATLSPAHTEQIMRELKVGGAYLSRDISRTGVLFDVVEYVPPPEAIAYFNRRVDVYREIYDDWGRFGAMNQGPKKASATFGVNGDIQGDAKRAMFAMRLPGVIKEADAAIARGEKVVISLVNVSEVEGEGGYLRNAISKINTEQVSKLGQGMYTDPSEIPEALAAIAELREKAAELGTLPSPIEFLRDKYGDNIAFVIGETSVKERARATAAFQNDNLDVIVISGAGKTGINLHDMTGKRAVIGPDGKPHAVHLIVAEYEWSATIFKQEMGRVDRTGEKSAPWVSVMHSGSAAERKFIATISNRMKGVGAVCKGGAESTGTAAMTDVFELGSTIDRLALNDTWLALDRNQRGLFLDHYFQDPEVPGLPKSTIDSKPNTMKKFLLALQSMYIDDANKIMEIYTEKRAALSGSEAAAQDLATRTAKNQGEIVRSSQLAPNLRLTEVKNEAGEHFAVLDGVLTPHMNQVKNLVASQADRLSEGHAWMR